MSQKLSGQNRTEGLERAKKMLAEQQLTCVMISGEKVYISKERGVKPILSCYEEKNMPEGFTAADKVVGKAAAFLYVLLGVKELYAEVLSRHALEVLQSAGIAVSYGSLTDAIRNRSGTGFCPMETAVRNMTEPLEALEAIRNTAERLRKQENENEKGKL